MKSLKENVAVVGVGGCGTNIAFLFEKLGYTTVHINSSVQDEGAIAGAKNIKHLNGFNGCAGNREKAMEAIAKNQDIIDYICELEEDIIIFAFAAGGGTGSGIAPTFASIVSEETEKTVCCMVVLPDKSEDLGYLSNAYSCAKELSELESIGATIFVDNNRAEKKSLLNEKVVSMLNVFLTNNSVSAYGNVDEEEKRTLLAQNGNMIIHTGDSETHKVIEAISTNNIFAPIQKDNVCEYIAIINAGNKGIDKDSIANVLGRPRRTFVGYGSSEAVVIASGLTYPLDYILEIGQQAKEKSNARQSRRKLSQLDDLGLEEVPVKKTEPKKKSSRDALMRFAK